MKRTIALFAALLLLAGCGQPPAQAPSSAEGSPPAITNTAEHLHILLPYGANGDIVAEHTGAFIAALQDALAEEGWAVGEITVDIAETDVSSGRALDDGTADLAIMPASQYFPYSESVTLLMTATKPGLSVDTTDIHDWNGSDNAPTYTAEDCPYGRTLICATTSPTGRELAQKAENGVLTWEDVASARWLVPKIKSSADFIYPDLWLQGTFHKTTEDLEHIFSIDGYSALFTEAGLDEADIIVMAADMRINFSLAWQMDPEELDYTGRPGLGHADSIFNDLLLLGVSAPIYGDVLGLSTTDETLADTAFHTALTHALTALNGDEAARAIFRACGYTGFVPSGDSRYNNIRDLTLLGVGD